jgi:hypothetical protein
MSMPVTLPQPPFHLPLTDRDGFVTTGWQPFVQALFEQRLAVSEALSTAQAAAPGSAEVVAGPGLQDGGAIGGNVAVSLYAELTSVALLPTMAQEGDWAYALDGRKPGESGGAGTGVPVVWSNMAWISAYSGAAVAA